MKDRWELGVVKRRIDQLRIGDRIDLFRDPIADPDEGEDHPEFAFEYAVVEHIEIETPECTRVDTSQGSFGFPPDHWIEVDGEQIR